MKMLTNILQWAGLTYGDMGHPFLRYLFHWWRAFWGGTVSINISFNDLGLLQQGLEPRSKVCEVNARPNEPKRGGDICIFKRKPKLFKILGCRVLWWPSLFRYQAPLWFFLQTLCFFILPRHHFVTHRPIFKADQGYLWNKFKNKFKNLLCTYDT